MRRVWTGSDLSAMTMTMSTDGTKVQKIPAPRQESVRRLEAAGVMLPVALPGEDIRAVTTKELAERYETT